MNAILGLIVFLIDIYIWVVFAAVILSWLMFANVLNAKNNFVKQLHVWLRKVTDPLFLKVRKIVPPVGSLDLSPIVVIFGLMAVQHILIKMMV